MQGSEFELWPQKKNHLEVIKCITEHIAIKVHQGITLRVVWSEIRFVSLKKDFRFEHCCWKKIWLLGKS